MDSFERFVEDLTACDIGSTFNFLREEDPRLDLGGGASRRRENLLHYLKAHAGAEIVAVGEAAGYQGARWSGIAFTSERTLSSWGLPYMQTSRRPHGWTEPSATIVHRELAKLGAEERVLLWNAVPTHPHRPGSPLTNRKPTAAESTAGRLFARRLIQIVQPRAVIAIGRVAESILDQRIPYIRHPANGGAARFADGLRRLLEADDSIGSKLPDYLRPGLRVVFCGTAAGTTSVRRGHYYAGPGNMFWTYLYRSGITTEPLFPSTDSRVLEFGVGLSDLAKTVAASSDRGLTSHYDVGGFVGKVERFAPAWVAFHGKEAAKAVAGHLGHGRTVKLGAQTWQIASAHVFVVPSASGSNQDRSRLEGKHDRVEWFKELAKLLPPTEPTPR